MVLLSNGEQLPKGSRVTGHVVEARAFSSTKHPMRPSRRRIWRYRSIEWVITRSRACAGTRQLRGGGGAPPQGIDESDTLGTMVLVGGAHYSPIAKRVTDGPDDDIVGYNKKQGVFARLLPGGAGCGEPRRSNPWRFFLRMRAECTACWESLSLKMARFASSRPIALSILVLAAPPCFRSISKRSSRPPESTCLSAQGTKISLQRMMAAPHLPKLWRE